MYDSTCAVDPDMGGDLPDAMYMPFLNEEYRVHLIDFHEGIKAVAGKACTVGRIWRLMLGICDAFCSTRELRVGLFLREQDELNEGLGPAVDLTNSSTQLSVMAMLCGNIRRSNELFRTQNLAQEQELEEAQSRIKRLNSELRNMRSTVAETKQIVKAQAEMLAMREGELVVQKEATDLAESRAKRLYDTNGLLTKRLISLQSQVKEAANDTARWTMTRRRTILSPRASREREEVIVKFVQEENRMVHSADVAQDVRVAEGGGWQTKGDDKIAKATKVELEECYGLQYKTLLEVIGKKCA
jgi:TolA-binding protein